MCPSGQVPRSVQGSGHCAARAQVWDLKDLGLQAAQRVAAAPQPLAALREVAQGFVNLAPALSRERVGGALRAEVAQKQSSLQGGAGPAQGFSGPGCWHHARAGPAGQHEQLPLAAPPSDNLCTQTCASAPAPAWWQRGQRIVQPALHPLLRAGRAAAARPSVRVRDACLASAAGRGAVPEACAGRQARARCLSTA